MSPSREEIALALFAFAALIRWNGARGQQAFAEMHRKVLVWDDIKEQPALCQVAAEEDISQTTGLMSKRTFRFKWVIYHQIGKEDGDVSDTETNAILDAIEEAFKPVGPDDLQRLNTPAYPSGAVHHAWLDGMIEKYAGDLDGQTMLVIPISAFVP